ncbi:hypothetical protein J1N51_13370 [Psychrosphaera ytuae]|uniref:Uncharacterized protein n=1 Tax=Psychrosphaera ytuae TaxID=2820710 RepID=A0A975DAR0_9GAMM|nr:hypothetical protein [Psychrosphaera ytuae]QTH63692.1 hypothetical protein J1N51_13370 [Psychrosphaera ytuae]
MTNLEKSLSKLRKATEILSSEENRRHVDMQIIEELQTSLHEVHEKVEDLKQNIESNGASPIKYVAQV